MIFKQVIYNNDLINDNSSQHMSTTYGYKYSHDLHQLILGKTFEWRFVSNTNLGHYHRDSVYTSVSAAQ